MHQDIAKSIPVVGYIRVSRVAGRTGDSFTSPGEQKKAIERLATREGLVVVDWYEELDASGGDGNRPKWLEAIGRVERGEVAGIAVYNFKRFTRSAKDAFNQLDRFESVGGKLYSATEDFDSNTVSGRTARGMTFVFAQDELERARESFATSTANAIERGVYISAKVPFGFIKNPETKKLEPCPVTACVLIDLFERRARGESVTALAKISVANGGPGRSGLNHLFANVAYLGWARSGGYVNEDAHEPLVSRELFDRVQAARGVRPRHTGALARVAMLRGLVRCGNCGTAMCINWDNGKTLADGTRERLPRYVCNHRTTKIDCDAPATIRQEPLDAYVNEWLLDYFKEDSPGAEASERKVELEQARTRLEDAETAFSGLKSDIGLVEVLGIADFGEILTNAKARVEMCRADVAVLKNQTTSVEDFEGEMMAAWPHLRIEEQNDLLHGFLNEVRVSPGRRKRGIAVAERVQIIDRREVVLNRSDEELLPNSVLPFGDDHEVPVLSQGC
jgi:DNA invertase Pin-like site-specific DNA recombinase